MADRRIVTKADGRLFLVEENDGWAYLKKGPQAMEKEIQLPDIKYSETLFQQARYGLKQHGFEINPDLSITKKKDPAIV